MAEDLVADFKKMLDGLDASRPGGHIEFLLRQMNPEEASLLKLCAIPHFFSPEIVQVLEPSLDIIRAESHCEALSSLSFITDTEDGLAIQSDVRQYLFAQWLGPPTDEKFIAANARLAMFFQRTSIETTPALLENIQLHMIFHLLGSRKSNGFSEFERLFNRKWTEHRLNVSQCLINLVHEYDAILEPAKTAGLAYYEGELAFTQGKLEGAESFFKQGLKGDVLQKNLQFKAFNYLGIIKAKEKKWEEAIKYYNQALKLAKSRDDRKEMEAELRRIESLNNWDEKRETDINLRRRPKKEEQTIPSTKNYSSDYGHEARPSDQPLIRLDGVTKVFFTDEVETHALAGVHMEINKGEYVSISGPSGCGKSTLLSILGLLDSPTDGEYMLNGRSVADLPLSERARIRNREVGFIFQSFNLIGDLNVYENVELPLTYREMKAPERKKRVMDALERVGMAHRAKHLPSQLSGGQQQRVAVARAVAGDPLILLADEPTGNLDSTNGEAVMDLMRELHQQGATICMVTHDPRYAKHSDRQIHLFDGRVVDEEHEPKAEYELKESGFEVR